MLCKVVKRCKIETFKKSMSVLSSSLGYQLKRRERRRSVVLFCCEIFSDNNHHSLYKKIKLYNDMNAGNPGPVYVNELPLS